MPRIQSVQTSDGCWPILSQLQSQFVKEKRLSYYQNHYISRLLLKTEIELKKCKQAAPSTEEDKSKSKFDDFYFFVNDQFYDLTIGGAIAYVLTMGDQRFASYFSKRNNIRLKALAKFVLPTLICFLQVLLRKRNPNSKLAGLLSTLKTAPSTTPCCDHICASSSLNSKRPQPCFSKKNDDDQVSLQLGRAHYARKRLNSKNAVAATRADIHNCSSLYAIEISEGNEQVNNVFDCQSHV